MYFAVLGKNPEISMAELQLVQAKEISYPKKGIVMFDTKYKELLPQLGGIIKAGVVVKEKELPELLADVKIIGIQSETNGKHLKRTAGIRRYKLVDIFHTDREIKNKGKEIINLENGLYGIVEQYQNIELYEAIDFGKPGRSMQMGMMPAKLTHMMINIGLAHVIHDSNLDIEKLCIYDPFVGSGTTGMLANYLGYDFIGSDIKTDYAEQNAKRWMTTKFATSEKEFTVFIHDITEPRSGPQPKDVFGEHIPNLIVTEGRLGPIIRSGTSLQDIQKAQKDVIMLYEGFIVQMHNLFFSHAEKPVMVFTIPIYKEENHIEQQLISLIDMLNTSKTKKHWKIESIPEIYSREGQQVARKILIIK